MDATLGSRGFLNWPELIVAEAFSSDEPRDPLQLATATDQPLDVVLGQLSAMGGELVDLDSRLTPEVIMRYAGHLKRSAYWFRGRALKERSQRTDTGDAAIVFTEWAGRIFLHQGAGKYARHAFSPEARAIRTETHADQLPRKRTKLTNSARHPAEAVEDFQPFP